MRRLCNLGFIGLRLSRPRGYLGTFRAFAISAIALLLVFAVLVMWSAASIVSRQQGVEDARTPREPQPIRPTVQYPLVSSFTNDWDGQAVTRVVVAGGKKAKLVHPPGIPRAPRPGEVFISPAVRAALPTSALLRSAVGERSVVGLIGEEGLLSPGERRLIYGVERVRVRNSAMTTTESFGSRAPLRVDLAGPLVFFGPLVLVLAAFPLLLALILVSRLEAPVTNARFALLGALGAGRGARYLIGAAELLPFGVGGALAGTLLFTFGWQRMSGVPGTTFVFWPSDTRIGLLPVLAVPVGCLLVLLGIAGWATASTAVPSTRPVHRSRNPRWWWLLPLAIALAALTMAAIGPGMDKPTRMMLALAAMGIAATGAPAAMNMLVWYASLLVSRRAKSAGSLVGGRWASDRANSAFKMAVALAALLLSIGVTVPFVAFLKGDTKPGEAGLKAAHGYNLLVSNTTLTARQWAALPGQRSALLYLESAQDRDGDAMTVVVATCDQVHGIVSAKKCAPRAPQWITIDGQPVGGYVADFRAPLKHRDRVLLRQLPDTSVHAALGEAFRGAVLMKRPPPGPPLEADGFLVNLPNGDRALKTFEAALADVSPTAFYGNNYTDLINQANAYLGHIQVLQIAGGVGLIGLMLSLTAAAMRSAAERTRTSSALSILGASPRIRIHAHAVGQALPTLLCTSLAVVLTVANWCCMAIIHSSATVPAIVYPLLLPAPLITSLVVVLLTMPLARAEPARLRAPHCAA